MTRSLYITVTHPDVPKVFTHRNFMVGPFRVGVSNKQHYRLYVAALEGEVFLKQASYPSIDQLHDALIDAMKEKRIPRTVGQHYVTACLPLLNKGNFGKGVKIEKLPHAHKIVKARA